MLEKYSFKNDVPRDDFGLGILIAQEISLEAPRPSLEEKLGQIIERRKAGPLSEKEERFRAQSRNMLRNGEYKPTGRSKPASEYLLRAVLSEEFPRINAPVDIINYISLKCMVPISLWDTDLAKSEAFVFRLGRPDESYVFNSADQVISLHDLICGFAVQDGVERPIVTPIKDSLATKTTQQTRNVAAVIYYPLAAGEKEELEEMLEEMAQLMKEIQAKKVAYTTRLPEKRTLDG